jgi:hypothetical protein
MGAKTASTKCLLRGYSRKLVKLALTIFTQTPHTESIAESEASYINDDLKTRQPSKHHCNTGRPPSFCFHLSMTEEIIANAEYVQ